MLLEKNREFGLYKTYGLTDKCYDCDYIRLCFGGCPEDRVKGAGSSGGNHNYLCESYHLFFFGVHKGPFSGRNYLIRQLKTGISTQAFQERFQEKAWWRKGKESRYLKPRTRSVSNAASAIRAHVSASLCQLREARQQDLWQGRWRPAPCLNPKIFPVHGNMHKQGSIKPAQIHSSPLRSAQTCCCFAASNRKHFLAGTGDGKVREELAEWWDFSIVPVAHPAG